MQNFNSVITCLDHVAGDKADYSIDYADVLPPAFSITGHQWTAPAGFTISNAQRIGTVCSIIAQGGKENQKYPLKNRIVATSDENSEVTLEFSRIIMLVC